MLVLGISDLEHDSAAALMDSSGPIAAIEEDKLTRFPASGAPQRAIGCCLHETGAQIPDVSLVGLASRPKRAWLRDECLRLSRLFTRLNVPRPAFIQDHHPSWKLDQIRVLREPLGLRTAFLNFEHHLCHAASAFYPSDFDRALILTLDEAGDMWSGLLALGEGTDLKIVRPIHFPNSLGWFYGRVTELLGFRPGRDEHKVQWLSKEGEPEFIGVFRKLFSWDSDGLPNLNLRYFANGAPGSWRFSPELRRDLRVTKSCSPPDRFLAASLARSAQDFLEEAVIRLAETYRKKTDATNLCVAGGVFLNVLLIHALEKRTGFESVFAQPVSGNPGTALGAAYLARKQLLGASISREPLPNLYLGPKFTESEIKAVLDNSKSIYRYLPSDKQLLEETVRLLQNGKIVAWYQSRLEFGHRALGNRSILASPFSPYVMENLNRWVKHREDFHPFALSVPLESASHLFDCTRNCRYMASVADLKDTQMFDRFAFNGRTVRTHTVDKRDNPRFWGVLRKFGEGAPAPVLINTSFNLFGEPLVCDPCEAIRSFYCSGIDALAIQNFLVIKR